MKLRKQLIRTVLMSPSKFITIYTQPYRTSLILFYLGEPLIYLWKDLQVHLQ